MSTLIPALALLGSLAASLQNPKGAPPPPDPGDVPKPASVAVGLAGSTEPDIVRYLNVRAAGAPSLSPDGTRVAFRTSTTGSPQIWVAPAAGGPAEQITFGEPISEHAWSPSGEWIFYGCDRGGNEREGFYLISPDGTRERELLPPSEDFRIFGGFSPDGKKIAYSTTGRTPVDFDIRLLDLASGSDKLVHQGKGGLYVVSWRPDGGALILSETRGEDGNDVHLLDLATGKLETIFKPQESAAYGSFDWKPDGSGFYLTTNQDRDFEALCFYDVAKKTLTVLEHPDRDVDSSELSKDGKLLAWITNENGYAALHVRNLETGAEIPVPDLPRGTHGATWARGAPVLAITTNGPGTPGDIWVFDARTGKTARSTQSSLAGLDPSTFVSPEAIDFPARDGVTLHGLLYLPIDKKIAKPPVVLAVHGGPTGQARPSFNASVQYLLARGIAVFDLNFRGSVGYGKKFARLDNQRLRPNAVRDMADAIEFLRKDGRVDASRAAVMGGSYGGYMTYAALTQLPELFKGGVSMVGVSNWVTALEGASPALKASDRIEYGNIDDPEDRKFFLEISPITHIKNIRAPIMVVHGANDPRDPVTESDQFVRAVRELGGRAEYLRFPDEGHGVRKLSNRIAMSRRVAEFLESILEVKKTKG